MKIKLLIISIVSCLSSFAVKFYNVNDVYGISVRETYSICKDNKGFIWASSKTGILRISDDDTRTYQLPCERTDIVSTKLVYADSCLLVHTISNGQLFFYNELYDRFDLLVDLRQFLKKKYINIWGIVADDEHALWIATSIGLYKYKDKHLEAVYDKPIEVQYITSYKENCIFVATQDGMSLLNLKTLESSPICEYAVKDEMQVSFLEYDDSAGVLWVGTVFSGLLCYDVEQKKFSDTAEQLPKQPILTIEKNGEKTLFIGFDGQGIWELSKDGKTVLNIYKENADLPFSLSGDGVYDILCDSNNKRVWVTTYTGGISFFDQTSLSVNQLTHQMNDANSLADNYVNKVLEDSKGKIWFATNNGISCRDVSTNRWYTYLQKKQEHANVFQALCEDGAGNIWAGTYSSGVYLLDSNTGKEITHFSHEKHMSGFSCQFVIDIFLDSQGDIWLGGTRNINCYLSKEKRFHTYGAQPVRSFAEFSPGKILLACTYGLLMLDKSSGNIEVLLENCLVQDILVIGDDIWAGTSGEGLLHYNYKTGIIKKYTTESGLLSNYINSLLSVKDYLWLGTENGLCRFSLIDNSVVTYTSIFPLSAVPFNAGSTWQLKNGNLIWGTNKGALVFNPDLLNQTEVYGKIYFQDINVSGVSIRQDRKLLEDIPIDKKSKLTLDYNRNNFILELLPIGGMSMAGAKFSWKMEGLDANWSKPSAQHFVAYPNLPSGDFKLKIRMYDSALSQVIDERSLTIRVIPPFWEMWWFRLILFIVTLGAIIYSLRAYSNNLKQRHARDKIRFFTNMAHDIRTSLTLVNAPIEELNKATELSEKSRYYLGLATEQSERLSLVANQLLDFQKIDSGKEKLYLIMSDVVKLVYKRVLMFETTAKKKNVELLFSSNIETYMTAIDELKMEKVIDNLLSNAIKYSLTEGKVEISLACTDKEWVLTVKDYGLGISNEAKTKLFKEFYRGDNAVNSKVVGSGVGLLLIKDYTMMHGGEISVDSVLNKGTSLKVTVPYKEVDKISQSQSVKNEITSSFIADSEQIAVIDSRVEKDKKQSLLIVEDNDDLRNFLKYSLEEQYMVFTANDGIEAWETIRKRASDLVISDIMMPGMNGFELCKRMKSSFETSHIPIILLTALSEKAKQLEGLGLGADDYIIKPFDIALLSQRIKTIIKNREVIRYKAMKLTERTPDEQPIFNNELNDRFVKSALETVRSNISNNEFGKDEFAAAMNVSSSLLYQKIKALTGQSPIDFIRTIRFNYALELLQSHKYTVTEVSEMCGFSSANYFSTAFKKFFGKSPAELLG